LYKINISPIELIVKRFPFSAHKSFYEQETAVEGIGGLLGAQRAIK
jgi:hypothetical protein